MANKQCLQNEEIKFALRGDHHEMKQLRKYLAQNKAAKVYICEREEYISAPGGNKRKPTAIKYLEIRDSDQQQYQIIYQIKIKDLIIKKENPLILVSKKQIDNETNEFYYEGVIPELKELQKGTISTRELNDGKDPFEIINDLTQLHQEPEFISKKAITGQQNQEQDQEKTQVKEKKNNAIMIESNNREQCIKDIKRYIKEHQDTDKLTLNYLRGALQYQPKSEFKEIIEKLCYKVQNSFGDNVYKLK